MSRRDGEFRNLYAQYYPLVMSYLASRVGTMDDVEDICQEVFIRFYKNFSDIREKRSWLLTAARYEISNYYNRKATAKTKAANIDELHNDPGLVSQDSFFEDRLIIRNIIEDPDNFKNEKEKLLFDLVAVYGLSYKETGRYLDMTRWQAEYKYHKIEKNIIKRLQAKGIKNAGDLI